MPAISPDKPYRVGRSRTGLGLFATKPIKKGAKIVRYFGPLLDCRKKKDDAIENIEPGEEINYDYGTDYFKAYLKPIGCKCAACEKKRKKKRAEARAEKLRLKAKAEKKALKKAEKQRLNGARANGKLLNGHGGKAAAGQLTAAKPGIFAEPASTQGQEAS